MLFLLLFFVAPIFLGAYLLGASWVLAAFIALVFYPAVVALVFLGAGLLDMWDRHKARQRAAKRRGLR